MVRGQNLEAGLGVSVCSYQGFGDDDDGKTDYPQIHHQASVLSPTVTIFSFSPSH